MKKLAAFLAVPSFLLIALLATSPEVFAQAGVNPGTTAFEQLVPCSGLDCQACHLVTLAQRLIRFLIIIAVPLAALLFAYAGFLYFSSAGNQSNVTKAKGIFINAFIGFVVALAAFLIVEVILNTLVRDTSVRGKWFKIECVLDSERPGTTDSGQRLRESEAGALFGGGGAQAPAPSASPSGQVAALPSGCSTCTQISALAVKTGAGNQVEADLNLRLTEFAGELGSLKDQVRVNEGFPPTVTHQNGCHTQGTCIDLGFKSAGSYVTDNILKVQNAAKESGLCTVYEPVGTCAGLTGVTCMEPSVSRSTGNHFSVYKAGSSSCTPS